MVTVKDFAVRQTKDGREFVNFILLGGLSLVQSSKTGNYYATVKQCSIPSTFDETMAKQTIGERVPGRVRKKSCEPYSFVAKTTGEIFDLDYRWVYVPEGATLEEAVLEGEPEVALAENNPRPLFAARF